MKITSKHLAAAAACLLSFVHPVRSQSFGRSDPHICLERFIVPPYPSLARLAEMEGIVRAQFKVREVEGECSTEGPKISGGTPELQDAVIRAFQNGWKFASCGKSPTQLDIMFDFALGGADERMGTDRSTTEPVVYLQNRDTPS
jgi:hypothetical protein